MSVVRGAGYRPNGRPAGKREILPCECDREKEAYRACDECRRRSVIEWCWDDSDKSRACMFENNRRNIRFHTTYSTGTAGVKGTEPLEKGHHHYWEIEMCSEVYGTDMMIGVGTEQTDLGKYKSSFVSLIGRDEHSWGLSYNGTIHHAGESHKYMTPFGQHAVIGIHLNLWSGTLEYYFNRRPMGIAFRNLQNKTLYPMISSTAARSGMNLVFSRSYPASLELETLLAIGKNMFAPENTSLFKCMQLPPGLLQFIKNNYWWITSNKQVKAPETEESLKIVTPSSSKKRHREQYSSSCDRVRLILTPLDMSKSRALSSTRTTTTRSMSKMAAGPASSLRSRSKSKISSSSSSSSTSTSTSLSKAKLKAKLASSSTTTKSTRETRVTSIIKETRNKRRLIDTKNNSDASISKKK